MSRKSTGSKLDALSREQRLAVCEMADGVDGRLPMSLEQLAAWLKSEWDVEIGRSALSEWLAKQREEKEFDAFLAKLADANLRADAIAAAVGGSGEGVTQSTVAALSAALQCAIVAGDMKARDKAAKQLAMVLTAHANDKKANAAVEAAQTMSSKHRMDVAKLALAKAAELQAIIRDESDEKTRVERTVKLLFGDKPKGVRTAAEVLQDEEAA